MQNIKIPIAEKKAGVVKNHIGVIILHQKKKNKNSASPQFLCIDVYEIGEHFVKENIKLNPTANFIFDELPIALDGNSKLSLFIKHHTF